MLGFFFSFLSFDTPVNDKLVTKLIDNYFNNQLIMSTTVLAED